MIRSSMGLSFSFWMSMFCAGNNDGNAPKRENMKIHLNARLRADMGKLSGITLIACLFDVLLRFTIGRTA